MYTIAIISCCITAAVVALCSRPRRVWRITGYSAHQATVAGHQPYYASYRAAVQHWELLRDTTAELDAASDWDWRIEEVTLR